MLWAAPVVNPRPGDPGTTFFVNGPDFLQRRNVSEGRPVETATGMKIDQGGLRQHFLDDFHTCLKKPRTKRAAFSQLHTGPTAVINQRELGPKTQIPEKVTCTKSRSLPSPVDGCEYFRASLQRQRRFAPIYSHRVGIAYSHRRNTQASSSISENFR